MQLLREDFTAPAYRQKSGAEITSVLPPAAVRIADREEASIVEVTRMDLNPGAGTATVVVAVFHRNAKNSWQRFALVKGTADQTDITPDRQKQIADDPRVKQVTDVFGGLGVRTNELQKAISIGAVVEVAQKRARAHMVEALTPAGPLARAGLSVLEAELSALPAVAEK
ncbi:MAG: hypothetical protein GY758_26670, partial [Fuerstiella sp.]|nr:hypothetical protein [Fuerstiella sp.]